MARYGWVQRYPAGKEAITGIGHEPWHFRYVGQPHAAPHGGRDLTLEEYIAWIRAFSYESRRYRHGNVTLSFPPAAPQGPTVVDLPEEGRCTLSGNNVDGFLLTEWGRTMPKSRAYGGLTPSDPGRPAGGGHPHLPLTTYSAAGDFFLHPVPGPGGGALLLHGHRPLCPGAGAGGQGHLCPLGRQVRKILLLYLVAVVLYLPIGWYAKPLPGLESSGRGAAAGL